MSWHEMVQTREPRPALLGLELEPYPYLSGFSVLLRVTRLTALDSSERFQSLGLRRSTRTVFADLQPKRMSRERFEDAMGLKGTEVGDFWAEEAWSPLQTDGALDWLGRPVRSCAECAAHGFHTSLFQLPSVIRCPWHQIPLHDTCRRCGRADQALFDESGRLGICSCGYDQFKVNTATVGMWSFPTVQAESWLTQYLSWARSQRTGRHFVAPQQTVNWLPAFAALALLPKELDSPRARTPALEPEINDIEASSTGLEPEPNSNAFWGWGALGAERPLTYVPLTPEIHAELTAVTTRVIANFHDTRTPIELVSFAGFNREATLGQNVARRPDCFIAPFGTREDGSTWLNLSALDLGTLQLCGNLIDRVIKVYGTDAEPDEVSRQAARAAAIGRIPGRRNLAFALQNILCRGYAQSLEGLLRSYLGMPPIDTWVLPVAEITGTDRVEGIRVCWVKIPPPRLASKAALLVQPIQAATERSPSSKKRRRPKRRVKVNTKTPLKPRK